MNILHFNQYGSLVGGVEGYIADFEPDIGYLHAVYDPAPVEWLARRLPAVACVYGR